MAQTNYVLDVNVWASSIITGKLHQLIKIAEKNIFFYTSEELLAELKEVLSRPKFRKYLSVSPQKYIELLNEFTTIVETSYLVKEKPVNSPDPDDNYLFNYPPFQNLFWLLAIKNYCNGSNHRWL